MDLITIAEVLKECKRILKDEEIVINTETKVTVKQEIIGDLKQDGRMEFRVVDQTSLIRPKKARIILYSDGDLHAEWNGFKDEKDILESVKK